MRSFWSSRPRRVARSVALVLALVGGQPISATAEPSTIRPTTHGGVTLDGHEDCTCRAGNATYRVGQVICLFGHVAVCSMDQNVTSWSSSSKLCPEALLAPVTIRGRSV